MATTAHTNLLGRLTTLGPRKPWEVALLLPRAWDDLRTVLTCVSSDLLTPRLGETVVLRGRLAVAPSVHYQPIPRTQAAINDGQGRQIAFTIFGNTRETVQRLTAHRDDLCLSGRIDTYQEQLQLGNAEIVHPAWAGRLRPRYPGKPSIIGAATVRERVMIHLRDALPLAEQYICAQVAYDDSAQLDALIRKIAGLALPLQQLLIRAHVPRSPEDGAQAQLVLEQLSALAVARAAKAQRAHRGQARWRSPQSGSQGWLGRARSLGFDLNGDQQRAVAEIMADLARDAPMHRLLTGDVGTGKTAVYAVAAAAAVDSGARGAILAPNTGLVAQIAANIRTWWPDLDILDVTGATKKSQRLTEHDLLIGTTALLHRKTGALDLVIVDEQHKFSRAQREQLLESGCHLLEATATCTPRSQALVELGINRTSRLHGRPVNNRRVETRLWHADQRRELMSAIESSLHHGDQVLVIYPERGETSATGDGANGHTKTSARKQASQAFELWEKRFPDRVRLTHGGLSASDKNAALDAMRSKEAQILISTTVVEVGIDLPGLMRVVVIHANRLGLVTLHQIRGRVARAGGTGHCDLFVDNRGEQVNDDTPAAERLKVLCETDDGFEIAEKDMRLRGFGDLSHTSDAEKGFLDGLLFQRPVKAEHIETAIALLEGKWVNSS